MTKIILMLLLPCLSLSAKEQTSFTRSLENFRVTVILNASKPVRITSIVIKNHQDEVELPSSLFRDIVTPHIGNGYEASKFQVERKQSKLYIRFAAGEGLQPDDHALILTLPLREASRITRVGDVTGYTVTHPSITVAPVRTTKKDTTQPKANKRMQATGVPPVLDP